jgi:site-specific recombinase XerD
VLTATAPPIHHYRDGDVVLYKRPNSAIWQCRYKLLNGRWQRVSTKQRNLTDAARLACERYDEARFRERNGLAPVAYRFGDAARAALNEMRAELAAGAGKRIYADYCAAIERYFLPFFGNRHFDRIDHRLVAEFEQWRNERIGHTPAHSTLLTYAAAWNRVQQTALERGWITETTAVPKLSVRGRKAQARPGFTAEEVQRLRAYMATWSTAPQSRPVQSEMRLLLRDYVELLLMTGMRHGTEAMRIEWQHWEWHTDKDGKRYLRLRVSGKTGARWLIAKHEAVAVLERMIQRDAHCKGRSLDEVLAARLPLRVFRFSTGQQPYHFNAVFTRLLTAAAMLRDSLGQTRTLYSLRHTYATAELLAGTDIHTLARQMGTSVVMLERHYSKLTATLAAGKLA